MIFACPHCRAELELPDGSQGRKARCPACSEVFVVEGDAPAPDSNQGVEPTSQELHGNGTADAIDQSGAGRGRKIQLGKSSDPQVARSRGAAQAIARDAAWWMRGAFFAVLADLLLFFLLVIAGLLIGDRSGLSRSGPDMMQSLGAMVIGIVVLIVFLVLLTLLSGASNNMSTLESDQHTSAAPVVCFILAVFGLLEFALALTTIDPQRLSFGFSSILTMFKLLLNLGVMLICLRAGFASTTAMADPAVQDYFRRLKAQASTSDRSESEV
jgi:hypothetical protein